MKLGYKISIFLLITVLSLFVFTTSSYSTVQVTGRKVVIDAGHGGTDFGSRECPGYPEKDANLDIAFELQLLLQNDNAVVYMTRNNYSETLSNNDRYTRANSTDGEVLVSIHLNGSTDHSIDGTLGLYGKRNKDEAFTRIMHDTLLSQLSNFSDFIDFGVTNFASGVLLKSNMPATIQEAVFISDDDECAALKSGTRQKEIAKALYEGLNNWFAQNPTGDDSGGGNKCDTPPCGKNK